MNKKNKSLKLFVISLLALQGFALDRLASKKAFKCGSEVSEKSELFKTFADGNTRGLWLFDESEYPFVTITDSSEDEYDLRLMLDGTLTDGLYGKALRVTKGNSKDEISYAGFQGSISNHHMRDKDGISSGSFSPTEEPRNLLTSLTCSNYTVEFLINLGTIEASNGTILDLGDAFAPGFKISISAETNSMSLVNFYGGLSNKFSFRDSLEFNNWHHVSFVKKDGVVRLYLDGKEQFKKSTSKIAIQALPISSKPTDRQHEDRGFNKKSAKLWKMQNRFNFSLGEDRNNSNQITASLDELRFSSVARYSNKFNFPKTFSRMISGVTPGPAKPTGLPLLFQKGNMEDVIPLGNRKHVFIDKAFIESSKNVKIKVNTLKNPEPVYLNTPAGRVPFTPERGAWRETIYEKDGMIQLFVGDGYSSTNGFARLYTSKDGITFDAPDLGGVPKKNIILKDKPAGAVVFKDGNPEAPLEETFKMVSWDANRGIYMYLSPDGINWRRNESIMLPFGMGGDPEIYWDDQRGLYFNQMKRGGGTPTKQGTKGRAVIGFKTNNVLAPWPFKKMDKPYFESWIFPLISDEGETVMSPRTQLSLGKYHLSQELYRARPLKYAFAPDMYLALTWRSYTTKFTQFRNTELSVSRDGENWKSHAFKKHKWLIAPIGGVDDNKFTNALSFNGIVRRGNEIWVYVEFDTDGAPNGRDGDKRYYRMKMPLDRFAGLNASKENGTAMTRPFTFTGKGLDINLNARTGSVKVALLNAAGEEISGYGFADNDEIKAVDSIKHTVSWKGKSDLSTLSNSPVRLKFKMYNSKVYSIKFN